MMLKAFPPDGLCWRLGEEAGGKAVIVVTNVDDDNVVASCDEDMDVEDIDQDVEAVGGEVMARAGGNEPPLL